MVSVDEAVKKVKSGLEEEGMWDNTLVIYFNDNGGNVWEGGRNYPYRGGKQSSHEGGSRAAAFIRFPPQYISTSVHDFDGLAHVSDVMPTVLGAIDSIETGKAGASAGPDQWKRGEGYDLSSAILSGPARAPEATESQGPRKDVLMAYDKFTNRTAYRFGRWKLISGTRGSNDFHVEPLSENSWIGDCLHDYICELIMHFQHWAYEDASGSLDEVSYYQTALASV